MKSSTRLYASNEAMQNPEIKKQLEDLGLLLDAVLLARGRVMMDLNVASADLDAVLAVLPSMRQPTISSLSTDNWHSVRSAIKRSDLADVIPKLKAAGALDIVTTSAEQLIS